MWSNRLTSFNTLIISESSFSLNGSMFSLIVPCMRKGSYGMNAIPFLKAWRPTSFIFWPSIIISPSDNSHSLKRAYKIEDFPAPVLPTIPTFIFGCIVKLRFLILGSKVSLYFIDAFLNSINPLLGQSIFSLVF